MDKKHQPGSEKFLQGLLRISKSEQNKALGLVVRQALSYIPQQVTYQLPESNANLLSSEKVLLTRKANELFRLGQIQAAEKIYLTVGYNAGLYKIAEHYFQKNDFLKAYLLFQVANDYPKANALTDRFVAVVRKWLENTS